MCVCVCFIDTRVTDGHRYASLLRAHYGTSGQSESLGTRGLIM